jgi:hypothetical protein
VLVGAHDGAVNHRIFVVGLGGQVLEEALPHPFIGPAAEPLVGVLPVAKPFRQIAPRNSGAVAVEHRFDESAIVVGGDADITGFAGQQVLDSLPLVIAKCISVHGSALFQADSSWITQTVVKVDSFYYTVSSVDSFYVQPSKYLTTGPREPRASAMSVESISEIKHVLVGSLPQRV